MTRSPLFAGPAISAVAFVVSGSCAGSISCSGSPEFASFKVSGSGSSGEVFLFGFHWPHALHSNAVQCILGSHSVSAADL